MDSGDWLIVISTIIFLIGIIVLISLALLNIHERDAEYNQLLEEFKRLSCTEKRAYLLDNDYTNEQRDYYAIECDYVSIGDLEK